MGVSTKKRKIAWRAIANKVTYPAIQVIAAALIFFGLGGILAWAVTYATESAVSVPYWTGVAWETLFLLGVVLLWLLVEAIKYVKDNW